MAIVSKLYLDIFSEEIYRFQRIYGREDKVMYPLFIIIKCNTSLVVQRHLMYYMPVLHSNLILWCSLISV